MKPSKLERFLGIFTDVKAGEGVTALLMFVNVFLILCAYYFIKPLREGWIAVSDISGLSKMEVKAYSSFGQSLLLIPVVWFFGRLSSRYHRSALITRSTLFCILNSGCFLGNPAGPFPRKPPVYRDCILSLGWYVRGVCRRSILGFCRRHLLPRSAESECSP